MGRQLSEDGLWWWDGTRWQPTGVAAPPSHRGGSPWPWVAAGCGAAILVVVILGAAGFYAISHGAGFTRGYTRQYVLDSAHRLARIDADAQSLQECRAAPGTSECSVLGDRLAAAAATEARALRVQASLGVFPACLKPYATQEASALDEVAAAGRIPDAPRVTSALQAAHNALDRASACEE